MQSSLHGKLEKLEEKIRILEEENELLSERAEDTLLTGLVTKSVDHVANKNILIENVLEKISILKSIPFCTCCRVDGKSIKKISTYTVFSDDNSVGYPIVTPPHLIEELERSPRVMVGGLEQPNGLKFNFEDLAFTPATVAILPFQARSIPIGMFIFIDDDRTKDRLSPLIGLLQQIVDMTVQRLDKISLIEELQHINAELDHTVEIRTKELKKSNRKLKNEIAERKRSAEALRESDHKFKELFNNATDAIYLWQVNADDTIGRCLEANEVACKMLGYSREELLTFTPKDIDTRDAAREIPRVTRKLLEEKHVTFEMIHQAKDGREIPVEINAHIFELSGKQVILSVTRDISERKKSEAALKQQNLYLSALHETTLGLMRRLDLNDSLKAIINRAAALVQTQDGFIFLYDPQANELVLRVGVGVYNKRVGLLTLYSITFIPSSVSR